MPDSFGAYVINNVLVKGKYDMPEVGYFGDIIPDYISLYSDVQDYHKTPNTCVCFFQYDEIFDSMNGLWNSIIHKNEKMLSKYRERFKNVKFITCPDYSITGDMPLSMQIFNEYRSRVVAIWLREFCGCIIIPNLRFNNNKSYDYCFDGIAYNSTVCLSILGLCAKPDDTNNLINGLHESIKRIRPSKIIIYGECNEDKFDRIFAECKDNNIQLERPNNKYKDFWRKIHGETK